MRSYSPVQSFTRSALIAACLLAGAPAAHAQFGGGITGKIVSVRADIIQLRPQYSTKLTRIVIDDKTEVSAPQMTTLAKLQPGTYVMCMGQYDDKGAFVGPQFVMAQDSRSGFFSMPSHGITSMGYGHSAMLPGKLKSAEPLVIVDDDGKEYPLQVHGFVPVMHTAQGGRDLLQVGKTISASGDATADGLMHATSIEIQGGGPFGGGEGSLFGAVTAVNGATVVVKPKFSTETVEAEVGTDTAVLRQVNIDPDSVKVGDTLTVQGKKMADGQAKATVLLVGSQTYPKVQAGGFFAMMLGGGQSLIETGTVASLSPLRLTLKDGSALTVTVPGQTPVVDLQKITIADLKPGDKVMLVGSEGEQGAMHVRTLVLGASAIVGFGD